MTMIDSLAISIPLILTILGLVIAFENYKLNKKKSDNSDKSEALQDKKEEVEREKDLEIRLMAIEKDVQYIRLSIDNLVNKVNIHDEKINNLEKDVIKKTARKGTK